jgi:hypothetical protein
MGDDPNRPKPRSGPYPVPGSKLTPLAMRAENAQAARREIPVDDFVDTLRERPKTMPEMALHEEQAAARPAALRPTKRGIGPDPPEPLGLQAPSAAIDPVEPDTEPDAEPPTSGEIDPPTRYNPAQPNPGWTPAAPPRPGTTARTGMAAPAHAPRPQVQTIKMAATDPRQLRRHEATVAMAAPETPPAVSPAPPPAPATPPSQEKSVATMMLTPEQAAAALKLHSPQTGLGGTLFMEAQPAAPAWPPSEPASEPITQHAVRGEYPAVAPPPQARQYDYAPQPPAGYPPAGPAPQEGYPEASIRLPRRSRAALWAAAGITIGAAVAIAVAYARGMFELPGAPRSEPSSKSSEPAAGQTTASAAATETAAPSSSASTTPSSPPAATQAPSASAAPAQPPVAGGSTEPLLSYQGGLTVRSSADAEVVVHGQSAGRTNQRLVVRCGSKNVRLRGGTEWMSPGEHVHVVCMQETTVTIEPSR